MQIVVDKIKNAIVKGSNISFSAEVFKKANNFGWNSRTVLNFISNSDQINIELCDIYCVWIVIGLVSS